MRRRTFLRSGTAAALAVGTVGVATAAPADGQLAAVADEPQSQEQTGIVWTRRDIIADGDGRPGQQNYFDVLGDTDSGFALCGYTTASGTERTQVRLTDGWGRSQSFRQGSDENAWGDRGYALVNGPDGTVLAAVENSAPKLVGFVRPGPHVEWKETYDGGVDGAVHAARTGYGYAIGWTDGSTGAPTVVGTDENGIQQWTDKVDEDRRMSALVNTDDGSLVAVGSTTGGDADAWVAAWAEDFLRDRNDTFGVPGEAPDVAAADGDAVVLAGTTDDGWWFQRRAADWTVDWTQTFSAEGNQPAVEDVAVRSDGYGLLAHDGAATVIVRTGDDGTEQWRGRYAPYADGDEPPVYAHALAPVEGDQFVIAGAAPPIDHKRDWWWARVGEPGQTTPKTPAPTPTPGPTTTPPPAELTTVDTDEETTDGSDGTAGTPSSPTGNSPASTDVTPADHTPATSEGDTEPTSGSGPGFGIAAAVAGLAGWLASRSGGD